MRSRSAQLLTQLLSAGGPPGGRRWRRGKGRGKGSKGRGKGMRGWGKDGEGRAWNFCAQPEIFHSSEREGLLGSLGYSSTG